MEDAHVNPPSSRPTVLLVVNLLSFGPAAATINLVVPNVRPCQQQTGGELGGKGHYAAGHNTS